MKKIHLMRRMLTIQKNWKISDRNKIQKQKNRETDRQTGQKAGLDCQFLHIKGIKLHIIVEIGSGSDTGS